MIINIELCAFLLIFIYLGTENLEIKACIYNDCIMINLNVIPTEDRVLIVPEKPEEKTPSGLIIPQEAKEESQIGKIINVGPGKDGTSVELKIGQRILYSKYSCKEVKLNGTKCLILRAADVLAVIE